MGEDTDSTLHRWEVDMHKAWAVMTGGNATRVYIFSQLGFSWPIQFSTSLHQYPTSLVDTETGICEYKATPSLLSHERKYKGRTSALCWSLVAGCETERWNQWRESMKHESIITECAEVCECVCLFMSLRECVSERESEKQREGRRGMIWHFNWHYQWNSRIYVTLIEMRFYVRLVDIKIYVRHIDMIFCLEKILTTEKMSGSQSAPSGFQNQQDFSKSPSH